MGDALRSDTTSRVDWRLNGPIGMAPKAVRKNF